MIKQVSWFNGSQDTKSQYKIAQDTKSHSKVYSCQVQLRGGADARDHQESRSAAAGTGAEGAAATGAEGAAATGAEGAAATGAEGAAATGAEGAAATGADGSRGAADARLEDRRSRDVGAVGAVSASTPVRQA